MLPSPNHSFRNSCLLLMCGTRKLQCHVQGLQPIEICGIGKRAQMNLLCWLPSLPWNHHKIQNLRAGGRQSTSNLDKKKERKKLFLIKFPYVSANSFPLICQFTFHFKTSFLSHRVTSGFGATGMLWWRGLLHLTNNSISESLTKRPNSWWTVTCHSLGTGWLDEMEESKLSHIVK